MKNLSLILILLAIISCKQNADIKVLSPNNKIQLGFGINELSEIYYSIIKDGDTIIYPSYLGFQISGQPEIGKNTEIVSSTKTYVNQKWTPVYGERSEVLDNYNQNQNSLKRKRFTSP